MSRFVSRPRHPVTHRPMWISAPTHRELQARLADLDHVRFQYQHGTLSALDVDHLLRPAQRRRTLEQAARAYASSGVAANTARRVESLLANDLAELAPETLHALDAPRLARWIERLRTRHAKSTVLTSWRTLRAIVRHASEHGWIAATPWGDWRPSLRASKTKRAPREAARDPLELARLLAGARDVDARRHARGRFADVVAKIATAGFLGLRQGELAGLRWPDVDAGAGAVLIARQYDGDPTKTRTVDVVRALPELFVILAEHLEALKRAWLYDPKGPVFPCVRASIPDQMVAPYTGRAEVLTRAEIRDAVRRAGLPNPERWSAHSLRDTFVTLENYGAAGDLALLAQRSRHASVGSLVRYLRARTREAPPPMMQLPAASPRRLPAKRA